MARQAQTRAVNNLVEAMNGPTRHSDLKRLVEILKTRAGRLRSLDEEILANTSEEDLETEYEAVCSYEDAYIAAVSSAEERLSTSPPPSTASIDSAASNAAVSLPRLRLPSFAGDRLEWRPFWSQFEAAVHHSSLPEVQKLTHLFACLKGPALDAVKDIQIVGGNYDETVELLRKRFGDPSALIGLYASQLVSTPAVKDGDYGAYRTTIDAFATALREIRALIDQISREDASADPVSVILSPLLLAKLPPSSRLEWNRRRTDPAERFALDDLCSFAEREVDTLCHVSPLHAATRPERQNFRAAATSLASSTTAKPPRIKDLPVGERLAAARAQRLCFNCLSRGHSASNCSSPRNCSRCHGRHHDLLHGLEMPQRPQPELTPEEPTEPSSSSLTASSTSSIRRTILQTAVVRARTAASTAQTCRLLVDGGSEHSFITRSLVRRLRAETIGNRNFAVEGFGGRSSGIRKHERVRVILCHRRTGREIEMDLWVVEELCNPLPSLSDARSKLPRDIALLDLAETFCSNRLSIDIIVGGDQLNSIIEVAAPVRSKGYCAWSTIFGWVVSGPATVSGASSSGFSQINCLKATTRDPSYLWDLEAIGIASDDLSDDSDLPAPEWTGTRYSVKLPWVDNLRPAFSALEAKQRLGSYYRLPPAKHAAYLQSIAEWEEQGIIEASGPIGGSFIPHHGVSQKDKLRVVIDGSATPRSGRSINDCLSTGPPVDLDLPAVIHRFRSHLCGLSADISKAYLMIDVDSSDRSHLNLTELQTVVSECAERVNRRPLDSKFDTSTDPLTPVHFPYGCAPPPLLPAYATTDETQTLVRRWRHRMSVSSHLWARWRSKYLSSLRNWHRVPSRATNLPKPGGGVVLLSTFASRQVAFGENRPADSWQGREYSFGRSEDRKTPFPACPLIAASLGMHVTFSAPPFWSSPGESVDYCRMSINSSRAPHVCASGLTD